MKIRICIDCNIEMEVPKTSGKKRCSACNKVERARKARVASKKNWEQCKEKIKERARRRNRESPQHRMLSSAKQRAKNYGLPFSITLDDIIIPSVCPILKVPMVFGTEYAPSLDRIVPNLGYTKGNIQVISWKSNTMKNSASPSELKLFADWVFLTQVEKLPQVPEITLEKKDDE